MRDAWSDRAHVTVSRGNDRLHHYNREYFDKPHKKKQEHNPIEYIYKTPYDPKVDYKFYKDFSKHYWERRAPIDPES